jgi:hypothetical protein
MCGHPKIKIGSKYSFLEIIIHVDDISLQKVNGGRMVILHALAYIYKIKP